eukprot:s2480_g5.t7
MGSDWYGIMNVLKLGPIYIQRCRSSLLLNFLKKNMTIQSPEEAALLATICDRGSAEPAIRTFMPLTASPELETPSFQHETTSPHAPAMAAKGEVADRVPAILSHVESDLVSLAICGYIGGRCMHLKYPGPVFPSAEWVAWGLAGAMLTAFGGGSMYVLLMKRSGDRRFGWQDPLAVSAALLGFLLSTYFVPHCGSAIEELLGIGCGAAFNFFDCVNNAILIAWGTSKRGPCFHNQAHASHFSAGMRYLGTDPKLRSLRGARLNRGQHASSSRALPALPRMGLLPAVVATGGSMKHCAAQPVQWLLLICLAVGVSCWKLASEMRLPADFLQLESLAEDHRSLLSAGHKEHRTRMDSYKNLKQTITKLGNQGSSLQGASRQWGQLGSLCGLRGLWIWRLRERERDSIALAKERKRLVFRIGQAGA